MADIGVSPSQLETIVPGLQYGLQQMSSMITSRREVVVHAQPGTYDSLTSRLIRSHVADGSSWWQMATTKLVFDIVNTSDHPLELLVPPLGLFEQFRLLSQGTVLELIESYSRTVSTYNALLPLEARVTNSLEQIPLKDPHGKRAANDGREDRPVPDFGEVFAGAANKIPVKTGFETERYVVIPGKGRRTVLCSILSGVLNSQFMWPLMHCSQTLEFQLVSDPASVVASTVAAVGGIHGATDRSQEWRIELPRLEM